MLQKRSVQVASSCHLLHKVEGGQMVCTVHSQFRGYDLCTVDGAPLYIEYNNCSIRSSSAMVGKPMLREKDGVVGSERAGDGI